MKRSPVVFGIMLLVLIGFQAEAINLQVLRMISASPSVLPDGDRFADPSAPYGIARLALGTTPDQLLPLGGLTVDTDGSTFYLAVNNILWNPVTGSQTRVMKFSNVSVSINNANGLVDSAVANDVNNSYLMNDDLQPVVSPYINSTDYRNTYLLGMGIDKRNNDLFVCVQSGVISKSRSDWGNNKKAILWLPRGDNSAQRVIEFAAPNTIPYTSAGVPQPAYQLYPGFSPRFDEVLVGPESIAHYLQASATDVFYFTDATTNDFSVGWAVEDFNYRRQNPSLGRVINLTDVDDDFFTDEMRIHASPLAGSFLYDKNQPTVFSDVVFIPVANRMAFCSGRASVSGLFLVDDLNDNTENGQTDSDLPQVNMVLNSFRPVCLANVFNVNGFNANTDILLVDYNSTSGLSKIYRVRFDANGAATPTLLDLTTPNDAIPGRISRVSMDAAGNIYAVEGDAGIVYVIARNVVLPTPTPTPPPNTACFETQAQAFGSSGRFTMQQLVNYITVDRGQNDVITELKLRTEGDLENYLPRGNNDIRRFYYINRPIKISNLDRLTIYPGEWLIFRSQAGAGAFLEVSGRLITNSTSVLQNASGFNPYDPNDDSSEGENRYTSVQGFICWLKSRGVNSFAALNWTPAPGNAAAVAFQQTAQAYFNLVPSDPAVLADLLDQNAFNGNGRWGGLYFNEPDVGSSSKEASSVGYSRIEFAECGIYCQDRNLSVDLLRNENALRVIRNLIQYNLIGISIDSMSPLIAYNRIHDSRFSESFDLRSFGGISGYGSACLLGPTQRFPIGNSGTGIYITKRRSSTSVACSPMLVGNSVYDNSGNGIHIQQPGVGDSGASGSFGSPTTGNRPKPLLGRKDPSLKLAHEFQDVGMNLIYRNGGLVSDTTYQNFVYNVEELPADFGTANVNHVADISAYHNFWGNAKTSEFEKDIRDGKDLANLGEVVTNIPLEDVVTNVESSTELYE